MFEELTQVVADGRKVIADVTAGDVPQALRDGADGLNKLADVAEQAIAAFKVFGAPGDAQVATGMNPDQIAALTALIQQVTLTAAALFKAFQQWRHPAQS